MFELSERKSLLPGVLFLLLSCSNGFTQSIEKITYFVNKESDYMEFPFAGGLDAPQFSQADLNSDGLQDVFVFDRQGNTAIPFITTFNEGVFGYKIDWATLAHFPSLQNWALLRDFNGDGIEDLFASTNEPGVQGIDVYRGRYEGDYLAFEKMTFDLGQFDVLYFKLGDGFTPLYAAWIDIPAINDIDGDGDVDILSFEPSGSYVHYFRNLALEEGLGLDTFLLDWEDVCWGKFLENSFSEQVELSPSPGQCASGIINMHPVHTRHSGSTLFAFDYDSDEDQDLLIGDLSSAQIKLLVNGGDTEAAWITEDQSPFPVDNVPVNIPYFVSPFVLDINHDAIPDFVAASNNTSFSENYHVAWFYSNDGNDTASFNLEETALFVSKMIDYGSESKPAFFDYNADGLMDILFGTGGFYTPQGNRDARLVLMKNVGTATEPMFNIADEDYQGFSAFVSVPTWEFAPASGDLDEDGDVDLLVGERNGGLFYLENIAGPGATATFAQPVYPYANLNVGTSSTPAIIDLNEDGRPDIVIGERTGNNDGMGRCSNLNYFQNVGTKGNPAFISDPSQAPNTQCLGHVLFNSIVTLSESSAPAFIETQEGLRLVTGSETGEIRIYGNLAASSDPFTLINNNYGSISDGDRTVPAFADLDDDGFYEMVLGNRRGGLTMYHTDLNTGPTAVPGAPSIVMQAFLAPNPSNGNVFLHADDTALDEIFSVQLSDVQGRVVCDRSGLHHGDVIALNVQQGLYIAVIRSGETVSVQKLVIND